MEHVPVIEHVPVMEHPPVTEQLAFMSSTLVTKSGTAVNLTQQLSADSISHQSYSVTPLERLTLLELE